MVVPYRLRVRNTATGAWQKRWESWVGRGASGLRAARSELDSPFVRCREADEYQRLLAGLLADVRCLPGVPTLVATDLFVFIEDLKRLYVLANRAYWTWWFYFEARVRERQKLLAGWHNEELSILRISDRPVC